jgi:hypothetical protein
MGPRSSQSSEHTKVTTGRHRPAGTHSTPTIHCRTSCGNAGPVSEGRARFPGRLRMEDRPRAPPRGFADASQGRARARSRARQPRTHTRRCNAADSCHGRGSRNRNHGDLRAARLLATPRFSTGSSHRLPPGSQPSNSTRPRSCPALRSTLPLLAAMVEPVRERAPPDIAGWLGASASAGDGVEETWRCGR